MAARVPMRSSSQPSMGPTIAASTDISAAAPASAVLLQPISWASAAMYRPKDWVCSAPSMNWIVPAAATMRQPWKGPLSAGSTARRRPRRGAGVVKDAARASSPGTRADQARSTSAPPR